MAETIVATRSTVTTRAKKKMLEARAGIAAQNCRNGIWHRRRKFR